MDGTKTNTALKVWQEMSPLERRNSIEDTLKKNAEQLAMVLPNDYSVGKLIGTVLTSIVRNPKILDCTQASIFGSIFAAAQLGLDPNGLLGEGSLIPYNNSKKIRGQWVKTLECQFLPGYRGFLKLAYKSPLVKSIHADVVYEKDEFRYNKGLHPDLYHVPSLDPAKGEMIFVYAVVHLTNGGVLFDVMSRNEIETIRLCSKNKDGNAWEKWYDEMAKKSVIRRIFKITPITEATNKAVSLDERVEVLNQSQRNEVELVNTTVFSEITQEMDPSEIYNAEETEYEDLSQEQQPDKSQKVMDNALNTVKAKNGNGNGNGKHKAAPAETPAEDNIPDNVEYELRKLKNDLIFLMGEQAEYREENNKAMADKIGLSISAHKMKWRSITGKEFTNEQES